ncbi:hypothetical protein WT08_17940 [Burkholderia sp. MSMB1552]|nr:hypothetical protein WS76_17815 [Burkholderia humptydooensis]KVN07361.1 hypothetical protein WT08_17940 [Burkholderia sp. MSMB1552]
MFTGCCRVVPLAASASIVYWPAAAGILGAPRFLIRSQIASTSPGVTSETGLLPIAGYTSFPSARFVVR